MSHSLREETLCVLLSPMITLRRRIRLEESEEQLLYQVRVRLGNKITICHENCE